jgi:putative PIN family toxin of toxin-antitoxin system
MRPASIPGRALLRAWQRDIPLVSIETLDELELTLRKEKFARYFSPADVTQFLRDVNTVSERIVIESELQICRHPKDNKFLELAVDGRADLILTGDRDLLTLHLFRGIPIVTPMQYLAED